MKLIVKETFTRVDERSARRCRCYGCGGNGQVRMANGRARFWVRCDNCGGKGHIELPPVKTAPYYPSVLNRAGWGGVL